MWWLNNSLCIYWSIYWFVNVNISVLLSPKIPYQLSPTNKLIISSDSWVISLLFVYLISKLQIVIEESFSMHWLAYILFFKCGDISVIPKIPDQLFVCFFFLSSTNKLISSDSWVISLLFVCLTSELYVTVESFFYAFIGLYIGF